MYLFYILALIPLGLGLYAHHKNPNISVYEWLAGSTCAFIVAGLMHVVAAKGMTADTETWSGQIVSARRFPEWQEYYEYAVYRTQYYTTVVSNGKGGFRTVTHSRQVFSHWAPSSRHHAEYFQAYSNIDTEYSISKKDYYDFVKKFNHEKSVLGVRRTASHNSRMTSGDPYDYVTRNTTGWIEPVNKKVSFENRVKAAPSVFSFVEVPENIKVFPYPKNDNPWWSDRLMGHAKNQIGALQFEQLNARLGPTKYVNVILAGFVDQDSSVAEYQRAKWIGGRKNDLCLLYGWSTKQKKVMWSRVFGWSESDTCKRNLETALLKGPINNEILPVIEKEIRVGYTIKDWTKFDYLAIEPRTGHYIWYIAVMIVTQGGLYFFFHKNSEPVRIKRR